MITKAKIWNQCAVSFSSVSSYSKYLFFIYLFPSQPLRVLGNALTRQNFQPKQEACERQSQSVKLSSQQVTAMINLTIPRTDKCIFLL